MTMTHRERMETAWRFEEPDRVPIELQVSEKVRNHPKGKRLAELIDEHADNFDGLPGPNFGFLGFPTTYHEEVIDEKPGEYFRMERVHETSAGTFKALTYHPADQSDYHWEKRFISSLDDLVRLIETPRQPAPWDRDAYLKAVEKTGQSVFPCTGVLHPLGMLVRNSTMEEVYAWLRTESELIHKFLGAANTQVIETLKTMTPPEDHRLCFYICAHEMLIPPWIGHEMFDELVRPYDSEVNKTIHGIGGRLRAHCHGSCMDFLVKFADMGIDAIEPLEPPPYADVDLVSAKRLVGDRMLLSGNIPSQDFPRITPKEVRALVREAIRVAAPGGGFTLHTTGGQGGTSTDMDEETFARVIANAEAFMEAGLEYGHYPIVC